MITRRKPSVDDRRIVKLIREELIPISKDPDQRVRLRDIRIRLNKGYTYVSRTKNGVCTGFIHLMEKEGTMWIDLLAVRERFQGKGIGKRLLLVADRIARRQGKETMSLFVDTGNSKAIRFYEQAGFRKVQFVKEVNCIRMNKGVPGMA